MRLLVDEDLASRELIRRLESAFPGDVLRPEREGSDDEVWRRAQAERAAILTGNVVDFLRLASERPTHHGLLLVYRRNDPQNLRAADIVAGVIAIAERHPDGIADLILAVNSFARAALREDVARHDPDEVIEAINRAIEELGEDAVPDEFVREAARHADRFPS